MNDKYFDRHLKTVLENLESDYDPASWAALERRLDAAVAEEHPAPVDAVDKAVYHTLNRMEAPYQSAHWKLLAQRLQVQALRLRRLRLAKLAEAALVLLFLWHFPTLTTDNARRQAPVPAPRPQIPVAQAGPGAPAQADAFSRNSAAAYSAVIDAALQGVLLDPAAPDLLSPDYARAPDALAVLSELNVLAQKAGGRVYAAAELLPGDAWTVFPIPDRTVQLPAIHVRKFSEPGPFYIAASGSLDHNRVLVNGKRRGSAGHGGAVAVGYRSGKWSLETGLGYAYKNYTPKREVEIYSGNLSDGYFGSTLTEVQADVVSVPVKISRQIARLGKTTVHAVGGVSAHIAAQKTYDYGTVYYSPDALPPNFLPDPGQSPKLRKSGRGVLENGGLNGNIYATLDAGIRIERPLVRNRYTAFLEPSIRQSITGKGIGPGREPVNTLSIQAGVMAFL